MLEMREAGPLLSALEEKAIATRDRVTALAASAVRDGRKRANGLGATLQVWVRRFQRDAGGLAARVQRDGAEGLTVLEKRTEALRDQGLGALEMLRKNVLLATGVASQAEVRELARALRGLARRVATLENKRQRRTRAQT